MRDGGESGREQSHFVVTACLMMDAAGSLKVFFNGFSLFSPTDTSNTLLSLPHREAEINILTCVIHH